MFVEMKQSPLSEQKCIVANEKLKCAPTCPPSDKKTLNCIPTNARICQDDYDTLIVRGDATDEDSQPQQDVLEDSVCSGESLYKNLAFEQCQNEVENQKCLAFWRSVMEKNLKPIKCTLIKPNIPEKKAPEHINKNVEQKKKKGKLKPKSTAKDSEQITVSTEHHVPLSTTCETSSVKTGPNFQRIFEELKRKNLHDVKLMIKQQCKICELMDSVDGNKVYSGDENLGRDYHLKQLITPKSQTENSSETSSTHNLIPEPAHNQPHSSKEFNHNKTKAPSNKITDNQINNKQSQSNKLPQAVDKRKENHIKVEKETRQTANSQSSSNIKEMKNTKSASYFAKLKLNEANECETLPPAKVEIIKHDAQTNTSEKLVNHPLCSCQSEPCDCKYELNAILKKMGKGPCTCGHAQCTCRKELHVCKQIVENSSSKEQQNLEKRQCSITSYKKLLLAKLNNSQNSYSNQKLDSQEKNEAVESKKAYTSDEHKTRKGNKVESKTKDQLSEGSVSKGKKTCTKDPNAVLSSQTSNLDKYTDNQIQMTDITSNRGPSKLNSSSTLPDKLSYSKFKSVSNIDFIDNKNIMAQIPKKTEHICIERDIDCKVKSSEKKITSQPTSNSNSKLHIRSISSQTKNMDKRSFSELDKSSSIRFEQDLTTEEPVTDKDERKTEYLCSNSKNKTCYPEKPSSPVIPDSNKCNCEFTDCDCEAVMVKPEKHKAHKCVCGCGHALCKCESNKSLTNALKDIENKYLGSKLQKSNESRSCHSVIDTLSANVSEEEKCQCNDSHCGSIISKLSKKSKFSCICGCGYSNCKCKAAKSISDTIRKLENKYSDSKLVNQTSKNSLKKAHKCKCDGCSRWKSDVNKERGMVESKEGSEINSCSCGFQDCDCVNTRASLDEWAVKSDIEYKTNKIGSAEEQMKPDEGEHNVNTPEKKTFVSTGIQCVYIDEAKIRERKYCLICGHYDCPCETQKLIF